MEPGYHKLSKKERSQVLDNLKEILSGKPEVIFAFVYGSFLEDKDDLSFHDIDVGIYTTKMSEKDAVLYSLDLSGEITEKIKYPIDARVLNQAPINFLYHVIQGKLILDKDEDTRSLFMERVIRHYLDMKPLQQRAFKEAFVL
jgi:predicted nucleotidyltransferase